MDQSSLLTTEISSLNSLFLAKAVTLTLPAEFEKDFVLDVVFNGPEIDHPVRWHRSPNEQLQASRFERECPQHGLVFSK